MGAVGRAEGRLDDGQPVAAGAGPPVAAGQEAAEQVTSTCARSAGSSFGRGSWRCRTVSWRRTKDLQILGRIAAGEQGEQADQVARRDVDEFR